MITVLAEKPSVARAISKVLGATTDRTDWYEGNGYYVTWCRGHLVRVSTPLSEGVWRLDSLPIIPVQFELTPVTKDAQGKIPDPDVLHRLEVIRNLFSLSDSLIEATDAGQEGEGIFRNIYEYLGCTKPFMRLWASSLTEKGLREAFGSMEPGSRYDLLAKAARSREQADWLYGINCTRAATLTAQRGNGGGALLSVGRVQTVILKMVCDRYDEYRTFNSSLFWTIRGEIVKDGVKIGWRSGDKFLVRETAETVMAAMRQDWKMRVLEVNTERKTDLQPLPYNLSALQKEANARLKMSPADVEASVQRLYEYQLVSYPRTESRYMSSHDFEEVPSVVSGLVGHSRYGKVAKALCIRGLADRCVNDSKVVEHSPLMITGKVPGRLSETDSAIYDMILRRYLEAFCPVSVADVTNAVFEAAGRTFVARGRKVVSAGWRCMSADDFNEEEGEVDVDDIELSSDFPPLAKDEIVDVVSMELLEDETRPRPLLTEATLLSLMEKAGGTERSPGGYVKAGCGIGTAATRGSEIQLLFDRGYVTRYGDTRGLIPTPLGSDFYSAVKDMDVCSVELTASWDNALVSIKEGAIPDSLFMSTVRDRTKGITAQILACEALREIKIPERAKPLTARIVADTQRNDVGDDVILCPKCGAPMLFGDKAIYCRDCSLYLWKRAWGAELSLDEIRLLARNGRVSPAESFISKAGKPFRAVLALGEDGRYSLEFERGKTDLEEELPKDIVICPRCSKVMTWGSREISCECGLSVFRSAYGHDLSPKEQTCLIEKGSVGPLSFVSKKGKAYRGILVLKDDGSIEMTFP